jgi:DNA-binding transcriptional MerR regulator/methylmalonyl-CoA mutase cobalamin-binding subunit
VNFEMSTRRPPHEALPLRTVSRLTGLSPDVIRAWERRYQVVAPQRGPRGARLYSSADVARLRLLKEVVRSGRAIGDVAKLKPAELARLSEPDGVAVPARHLASGDTDAIAQTLAALARFDPVAVDQHLSEALIALGTRAFCRRIAAPLLEETGRRWSDGRLSVAEEHLLSGSLRNLLAGVLRIRAAVGGPVVLLATPSGERHEFGLLLAGLTVADAGVTACYLGTDLPAAEISAAARRAQAVVVGLGIVNGENHAAVEDVTRVERELPAGTELWLGGRCARDFGAQLPRSRAIVLHDLDDAERELERVRMAPRRGS